MHRTLCRFGPFFFKADLTNPEHWITMSPAAGIQSIRHLSSDKNPQRYSLAISAYVSRVSHLLTPSECSALLVSCSDANVSLHIKGISWLLSRLGGGKDIYSCLTPHHYTSAYVAALKISSRSRSPFEIQLPPDFESPTFVKELSASLVFDLARYAHNKNQLSQTLQKRLVFFIEKDEATWDILESLLKKDSGEVVHAAVCQALHKCVDTMSANQCIAILEVVKSFSSPPIILVSALVHKLRTVELRTVDGRLVISLCCTTSDMRCSNSFLPIQALLKAEEEKLSTIMCLHLGPVLEDCGAIDLTKLLRCIPEPTQSQFDRIQLRAFELADHFTCAQINLVLSYVVCSSRRGLLIAYPALNRIKRRFYEMYSGAIIDWGDDCSQKETLAECILQILGDFVTALTSTQLLKTDCASLGKIQDSWNMAAHKRPLNGCTQLTRDTLIDGLSSLHVLNPSFSMLLSSMAIL